MDIEYYLREINKEEEISLTRDKILYSILEETFDFWSESSPTKDQITLWKKNKRLITYDNLSKTFTLIEEDTELIIETILEKLKNHLDTTIQENYDKEDIIKTLGGI